MNKKEEIIKGILSEYVYEDATKNGTSLDNVVEIILKSLIESEELCLNCKVYPKINGSNFCNPICATLYKIEQPKKKRIKFRFIWFDIWIGVFIDRPKKKIYIGIIPTLIIIINLNKLRNYEKRQRINRRMFNAIRKI